MRHLILIKHSEHYRNQPIPDALMHAMGPFIEDTMKRGIMTDTAGLKPTAESKRVVISNGKRSIIDGPFTEAKEVVGGYAVVNTDTYEEAMDVARQFADLHITTWPEFEFTLEVRTME